MHKIVQGDYKLQKPAEGWKLGWKFAGPQEYEKIFEPKIDDDECICAQA